MSTLNKLFNKSNAISFPIYIIRNFKIKIKMKSIKNLVKCNLKYLSLFLAIIISFHLIITISSEITTRDFINNNEKKFSENEKQNKITENIICTKFGLENCFNILMKCCLAFMLGGIISERKFIFLGKI